MFNLSLDPSSPPTTITHQFRSVIILMTDQIQVAADTKRKPDPRNFFDRS